MNQYDYFEIFNKSINIKNKNVLEIGGAVPAETVLGAKVKSWTSIDINERRFEKEALGTPTYRQVLMDVCEMDFPNDTFDVVFSSNCFEHISDFNLAIKNIFRVLKPGGVMFTIFGPIWSGPDGHHTWVYDDDGKPLTFSQEIFPNWFHLLKNKKELREIISDKYSEKVTDDIIDYIYESNDISRLCDFDYLNGIKKFNFKALVKLQIKIKTGPGEIHLGLLKNMHPLVNNFKTKGFFWVLAKEDVKFIYYIRMYFVGLPYVLYKKMKQVFS